MKREVESRLINIDVNEFCVKLKENDAKCVGDFIQKRKCYDFVPAKENSWIRLRTNGKVTTLAIKEVQSKEIDGTGELEIEVSSFDDTDEILNKLGYFSRSTQENRRIEFELDKVKIDIDFWPKISPFVEFEAENQEKIYKICEKLQINTEKLTTIDIESLYKLQGIDVKNIKNLILENDEKEFKY